MERDSLLFTIFCFIIFLIIGISIITDFYLCYKEYIEATPRYIIHTDVGNFYALSYDVGSMSGTLYFTVADRSTYMTSSYFIEAIPGTKPPRNNNYNPEMFIRLKELLSK